MAYDIKHGEPVFPDGQQLDADGAVLNGFDYKLQVWVIGGIVSICGHLEASARTCCNAGRYAGKCVKYVPGHEERL